MESAKMKQTDVVLSKTAGNLFIIHLRFKMIQNDAK